MDTYKLRVFAKVSPFSLGTGSWLCTVVVCTDTRAHLRQINFLKLLQNCICDESTALYVQQIFDFMVELVLIYSLNVCSRTEEKKVFN